MIYYYTPARTDCQGMGRHPRAGKESVHFIFTECLRLMPHLGIDKRPRIPYNEFGYEINNLHILRRQPTVSLPH